MENHKGKSQMLETIINEGNEKVGEYKGYKYEIIRVSHSGHLCGYIYMDRATDKEFEIMESNFHGGVSWGFGIDPRDGKYGFDCYHSCDISPLDVFTNSVIRFDDYTQYRTMEYVENCLKNTIDLLIENKKEEIKITNSEEAEKHFGGSWVVSGDSEIIIKNK